MQSAFSLKTARNTRIFEWVFFSFFFSSEEIYIILMQSQSGALSSNGGVAVKVKAQTVLCLEQSKRENSMLKSEQKSKVSGKAGKVPATNGRTVIRHS